MWRWFRSLWQSMLGTPARKSAPAARPVSARPHPSSAPDADATSAAPVSAASSSESSAAIPAAERWTARPKSSQRYPILTRFRNRRLPRLTVRNPIIEVASSPYCFARPSVLNPGQYLDLSQDLRPERLARWDLPILKTPEDLAHWLQMTPGELAWLANRFRDAGRPVDESKAHYRYCWKPKKSGGYRLIEAPLQRLRDVQEQLLDDLLHRVPVHAAAHGFCIGRSVLTNAQPHVGQEVVVKLDLDNFYSRVRYSRVVAVFRGLGYSREVAIWLAQLTTSAIPGNLRFPGNEPRLLRLFLPRHLPQGAPTSPSIANLVAYGLDVRLAGLARSFGANYTRYGDDLTFSGDQKFLTGLRLFLPLVRHIIRQERFVLHASKRKILRPATQQSVTGVVVNNRPNISRREFDRLKATLHNCVKTGPQAQNHQQHPDFKAHLRGRIAFVQQLNPQKGAKLLRLYQQIAWE